MSDFLRHLTDALRHLLAFFDETTLFYTFSTMAQTIGTSFGILAAVFVFRAQAWSSDVERLCERICGTLGLPRQWEARLLETLRAGRLDSIRAGLNQHSNYAQLDAHSRQEVDIACLELVGVIDRRVRFRRRFVRAMRASVVALAFSIILLPLTRVIAQSTLAGTLALVLCTGLSIWWLKTFYALMRESLES